MLETTGIQTLFAIVWLMIYYFLNVFCVKLSVVGFFWNFVLLPFLVRSSLKKKSQILMGLTWLNKG